MFLAVTVGPVVALFGFVGVAVCALLVGIVIASVFYFARQRPSAEPANAVATQALSAAFVADREGLGVFKSLLKAIHANDRDGLLKEAQHLVRLVKEHGSFANVLEPFFLGQIKQRLEDPTRKRALLDYVSSVLGVDVHAALNALAKPATPAPAGTKPAVTAAASAVLLALAIFFSGSMASAGEIRGPQLYEASERGAVVDPPTFPAERLPQAMAYAPVQPGPNIAWKRVGDLTFDDYVLQRPAAPAGWYQNGWYQQPSYPMVRRRACFNCRYRR